MYVFELLSKNNEKQIETKLQLVIFFCRNHGLAPYSIQFDHQVSDFGNASRRLFLVVFLSLMDIQVKQADVPPGYWSLLYLSLFLGTSLKRPVFEATH